VPGEDALSSNLRDFVLGSLDEPQRAAIEERLVTEPAVFDTLGVIEDELLEAFLDGRLSAADRAAFEAHFLLTQDRRERAAVTKLLIERATDEPFNAAPLPMKRRQRNVWRDMGVAALAASLVLTAGAAGWLALRAGELQRTVDSLRQQVLQQQVLQQQVLKQQALAAPMSQSPTFTLTPGQLRAGGVLTRVPIPDGVSTVRFLLPLRGIARPPYRAIFENADAEELWTAGNLRPGTGAPDSSIGVLVPAALLSRGDYQVRLTTSVRRAELVDTYSFRVTR
jgi:hypothetical protein